MIKHCYWIIKQNVFYLLKKAYGNAVKKREKAINILEKLHNEDADARTANLLSNLYNNLSNTYLLMKRGNEAAKALRTAFNIRHGICTLGADRIP